MNLYEVIYYGSHGNGDAEDTIFLVRASDFRTAIEHVKFNASARDHNGETQSLAHVVYEIGIDLSPHADRNHPCILRGPYFSHAHNRGWKSWGRKIKGSEYTFDWEEKSDAA